MATILDCKKIQPQISEYIDGGLEGDSAWAIKLHLASCAVCTQVASDLTATTRLLQNLPDMGPSASFEAALARRLADQVLTPRKPTAFDQLAEWWNRPRLRSTFASAAAAMAVVVPAAIVITHHSATTTQPKVVAPSAATDPALDDLWNDHITAASSEPLADSGGMLPERASAGTSSL